MKEALNLALEALEPFITPNWAGRGVDKANEAYEAIKKALAQPMQEPVAWPCVIAEADFSQDTVTLTMQCTNYKVSAGKHWLSTTPPKRKPLTPEQVLRGFESDSNESFIDFISGARFAEAAHEIKE